MNHEKYRELLQLAIIEEISGEAMKSLTDHLSECDMCRAEFNELRQLTTTIAESGAPEPSERMLWETRRRLFEANLREPSMQSGLARVTQGVAPAVSSPSTGQGSFSPGFLTRGWSGWFQGFRWALSGAAAVVVGLLIGYVAFGRGVPQSTPVAANWEQYGHEIGPVDVSNVRFVETASPTGEIEIQYDLTRPVRLRAAVDDQRMQRMLAYALLNGENDGVRLQAINAVGAGKTTARGRDIKQALIEAMTSDPNAGVRKQSLDVLSQFPFDEDIKNACFSVLADDRNPGMRVAAINLLAAAAQKGDVVGPEIYDRLRNQFQDERYLRTSSGAFIQEANDVQ